MKMKNLMNNIPVINSFYEVMLSPVEKSNGKQIKVKTNLNLYPDLTEYIKVAKPQINKNTNGGLLLKY